MNKKLFLGMFAAATMLFATSCQNDELDAVQSGNEATISFNLGVEGGVKTRAISDGTGAKELHYRVFNEDGSPVSDALGKKVETVTSYPYEVKMTLAKGQKYKVAFFAKNAECNAYTVDDKMNLTIVYSGDNNNEKRDAFFKTVDLDVTGNRDIDVVLKRPFAQINVGVTNEDWDAAIASDINIQKSKVVIKNAATNMNLIDGSVSNPVAVTYDFGATPKSNNETLKVDLDGDGTAEPYNYLSMSYILVYDENGGAEKANLDGVEFTFKPTNPAKNDIVFNTGLNGVPVQRNWRTNIIGQILTGTIDFNITIDHSYDGETDIYDGNKKVLGVKLNDKLYETVEDALAAIPNNGTGVIYLSEDDYNLYNSNNKWSARYKNLTFVGTGNRAKTTILCNDGFNHGALAYSNVTFENVTIETDKGNYLRGFQHVKGATFKNCIIKNSLTLYNDGSDEIVFEGCTFDIKGNEYNVWTWGASATFNNCVFNCDGKAVLVYGEIAQSTITFNDCIFNDNGDGTVSGKAAIEVGSHQNVKYDVYINRCTVNGFDINSEGVSTGTKLWGNKDSMKADKLNVVIDGIDVL